MKNAPDRFTATMVYQSSSVVLATVFSVMPALFDEDIEPPVLVDHLTDGASAVLGGSDIPAMQTGPYTQQFLELIGERVGAVDDLTVTGGHCRVLISQALTDRRANAADTPGHESQSAVELPPPRHEASCCCCSVSNAVMTRRLIDP